MLPQLLSFLVTPFAWLRHQHSRLVTVPPELQVEVELLQFARLSALVPLLYISIAVITLASAIASQGDFPVAYQLVLPGILLAASIIRMLVWSKRREAPVSLATAKKHLRTALVIAIVMSLLGGFWSVAAYNETHVSRRVLAAVFVAFAGIASANCLASVPRAALAGLFLNLGPISAVMIASPDLGEKALAVTIIVVAMLQTRLILSQFQSMVQSLTLQKEMRELADTDPLTSLKNRRALDRTLQETIAKEADFSIALLDLDGFKQVNDQFGHAIGDALLIQVAERLMAYADANDMIARLGGDEFALLMPGSQPDTVLNNEMAKLSRLLALPYICDENWLHVSASVGVARFGKDGLTSEELLKVADRAVYLAKSEAAKSRALAEPKLIRTAA